MQDVQRLVKMANQIADNFGFHDDTVARTADHLRRFWAPSMRDKLVDPRPPGRRLNEAQGRRSKLAGS
jgi:hypothetical protein